MGKIIASYLLKVHLHAPEIFDDPKPGGDLYPPTPPTNAALERAVIGGLQNELDLGFDVTCSLAEKTDGD